MAKKYYAVRKGYRIGLFEDLNDYKSAVRFYKDAEGCGFNSLEKAKEYLEGTLAEKTDSKTKGEKSMAKSREKIDAYVDGSLKGNTGAYSVVFFKNDVEILRDYSVLDQMEGCTNIKSELTASKRAVELAIDRHYKQVNIFHDYNNTGRLVYKECKARDPFNKTYVEFMEKAKKQIDIKFVQVESKRGKNKIADDLCRRAIKEHEGI